MLYVHMYTCAHVHMCTCTHNRKQLKISILLVFIDFLLFRPRSTLRLAPALCQAEHPHGSLGPAQKGYVFQWFCNDLQGNAPKGGRGRRGAGRVPRSGARAPNISCRINMFILQLTFPRPGPLRGALPAAYPLRPPPALRSAIPCKNHWFLSLFSRAQGTRRGTCGWHGVGAGRSVHLGRTCKI